MSFSKMDFDGLRAMSAAESFAPFRIEYTVRGTKIRDGHGGWPWHSQCSATHHYYNGRPEPLRRGWPNGAPPVSCKRRVHDLPPEDAPKHTGVRMSEEVSKRILGAWNSGTHNIAALAEIAGVAMSTVRVHLTRAGVLMYSDSKNVRPLEERMEAVAAWAAGETTEQICRRFNVTYPTLYRWRHEAGIHESRAAGRRPEGELAGAKPAEHSAPEPADHPSVHEPVNGAFFYSQQTIDKVKALLASGASANTSPTRRASAPGL